MPKIFISYRRQDSSAYAGRLYDQLVASFGEDQIFMDTEQIAFGTNFLEKITTELHTSEVCLVVIGPHWLISEDGQRRLDQPEDVVRHEIETALRRQLRIIPVLVGGGRIPNRHELPETLAPLVMLNALKVNDPRFHQDVDALLHTIVHPNTLLRASITAQLAALRQTIRLKRIALVVTPGIILLTFVSAWVGFFDYFTLDTKLTSYTMLLGDLVMEPPRADNVLLVTIDEETERVLQKPFDRSWRHEHARVIETLMDARVKAVVFDLFFEEPSASDEEFLTAVKKASQQHVQVMGGAQKLVAGNPLLLSGLREAGMGWGILCIGRTLGYARTAPLAVRLNLPHGELVWPSIGLLAAFGDLRGLEIDGSARQLLFQDLTVGRIRQLPFSAIEEVTSPHQACPPLSKGSSVANQFIRLSPLLYWRHPPQRVPYQRLLEPNFVTREQFSDKIVLVGVTKSTSDLHRVQHGLQTEERYGVELHADMVRNLEHGIHVRPLSMAGQASLMIGMAVLGALVGLWRSQWTVVRHILGSLAIVTYLCGCVLFYMVNSMLINVVYPLAAFCLGASILGRMRRRATETAPDRNLRKSNARRQMFTSHLLVLFALCPFQMGFTPILVDVIKSEGSAPVSYHSARDEDLATLKIDRHGQALLAHRNMPLEQGDEIETPAASIAIIHFPEGHNVFVLPETRVRLGPLFVLFGELLVRARGLFTVETEFMTAGVEGTEFLFRAGHSRMKYASVSVVVLDGAVLCSSKERRWTPMQVNKAEQFSVRKGMFPTKLTVSAREIDDIHHQLEELNRFSPFSQ